MFFVNAFKIFTVLVCLTPEKAYYKKVQVFIVHFLSFAAVLTIDNLFDKVGEIGYNIDINQEVRCFHV